MWCSHCSAVHITVHSIKRTVAAIRIDGSHVSCVLTQKVHYDETKCGTKRGGTKTTLKTFTPEKKQTIEMVTVAAVCSAHTIYCSMFSTICIVCKSRMVCIWFRQLAGGRKSIYFHWHSGSVSVCVCVRARAPFF